MLHSTFSKFPFWSSVVAFTLSINGISADETPTPIVIENHMALANEAGEIVAPKATNNEEAFFIRRIAEFWKDGDFTIVKMQIIEFFDKYPESSLREYFLGILGDLYLQENNPSLALEAYELIESKELIQKILINKLHCYYDLNRYEEIVEQGAPYLTTASSEFAHRKHEITFLVAEGYFRQGLQLEDNNPQKAEYYEKSLALYESLHETAYREVAQFALAETHRVIGNYQQAARLYFDLAERYPEQQDDLLFQAGNLQAHFDPTSAIGTFSRIIDRGGKHASEAMFNRLLLLFKTDQYSSVLADYEKVAGIVPDSYLPTYKYIVGKSYYALDQYQEAIQPLAEYILTQTEPSDQLKNALLIQMTCAQKLADQPLYTQSLDIYQNLFPQDSELPKALFLHAMMLKENGEMELARTKLQLIKDTFPEFEAEEHFLFEYGYLAHEAGDWSSAYNTFAKYLKEYHESDNNTLAGWKIYFSSALHRLQEGDKNYSKTAFFDDLVKILAIEDLFSEEETNTYKLLYAKTNYELGNYNETYTYLSELIANFSEEQNPLYIAEAHYLSAICLYELQKDLLNFCHHLETAMELDPERYDKGNTHVHLFNGYLIASELSDNNKSTVAQFADQAASHLYTAVSRGDTSIKTENALWLANHYYQKVKDHTDTHWSASLEDSDELKEYGLRAVTLFEHELLNSDTHALKQIDENILTYEPEVLKLAHLYALQGEQQNRLMLISSLLEQQSANTQLDWQYKKHALYELGKAYKALGNPDRALETFNYISTFTTAMPTVMSNSAAFEVASMQYKLLDAQNVKESSPEVMAILNQLKDLQIQKNALSEPVHLEAALEYIAIRTDLATTSEKSERNKFYLMRFKEDFQSQADVIGQEYHSALEINKDKKAIYDCYMKYVEGELLRLDAEKYLALEHRNEFEETSENALAFFEEVKNSPYTPKELYMRTVNSIEKINALNSY